VRPGEDELEAEEREGADHKDTPGCLWYIRYPLADGSGALPEDMTTDGLHWKDSVYEILGAEIERVVATPRPRRKK